jgi:hypothetical protein
MLSDRAIYAGVLDCRGRLSNCDAKCDVHGIQTRLFVGFHDEAQVVRRNGVCHDMEPPLQV